MYSSVRPVRRQVDLANADAVVVDGKFGRIVFHLADGRGRKPLGKSRLAKSLFMSNRLQGKPSGQVYRWP